MGTNNGKVIGDVSSDDIRGGRGII